MFIVTENAQNQIADYFKTNEVKPVRVFLSRGCGGQRIIMTIDEKRSTDMVFKIGGFEYVVDRDFLKKAQPIEIDFKETGFSISSALKIENNGCSGCGSTGSCC